MSDKQRFQEIIAGIRSDLKYLKEDLFSIFVDKRRYDPYGKNDEVRNWILDVFLDKLFEVHSKIERLFSDFNIQRDLPIWEIKKCAEDLAFVKGMRFNGMPADVIREKLQELDDHLQEYDVIVEKSMGTIRKILHDKGWKMMKDIEPQDYVLPMKRAKYVKARDELQRAKQAVKDKNWDEVLNHLRPAIDLAIKEKFGFRRIFPMKRFLSDAEEYNFPLPSYTMIYDYFDEGSHRIHEGKLNTPWECEKALSFVAEFIDRLDLVSVSQEDINEFKRKCKAVS